MDTFERVRRWLAAALDLEVSMITPESTLGELLRDRPRRPAAREDQGLPPIAPDPILSGVDPDSMDVIELTMALEETFNLELSGVDPGVLARLFSEPSTTIQQIADVIDGSSRW